MGLVTGTTTHKLDLIRTYDQTNPYKVGVNGVTNIYTDSDGIETIEYNINGIQYSTKLTENIISTTKPEGVTNPNFNILNRSYIPLEKVNTNLDSSFPTTFRYTTTSLITDNKFTFKEEVKMGVVFQPKVSEDVFIERHSTSVFEAQSRLGTILTLEDLEEYNNGYYKVTKTE